METERRLVVAMGWGMGNGKLPKSKGFHFGVMKTFWNWIVMMVVPLFEYTKSTVFYTLKGASHGTWIILQ